MTSMEDINSTTTSTSVSTSGNFIDTSQEDYFRLYDASLDDDGAGGGGGEFDGTNLIVGIWNPQNNQTNTTTSIMMTMTDDDGGGAGGGGISDSSEVITSTWTSASLLATSLDPSTTITSSLPSKSVYTSSASLTSLASSSTLDFDSTDSSSLNSTDTIEGMSLFQQDNDTLSLINSTIAQTPSSSSVIDTAASQISTSAISSYASDDVDIALIDSAETLLAGEDDDYGLVGFNGGVGGGGVDSDDGDNLINQSLGNISDMNQNETFYHHNIFKVAGTARAKSGGSNGNSMLRDDAEDGGSSFMLLLEDFGEYFYNYNGSMVSGTTTTSATSSLNITNFDYRTNCTNYSNLTTNLTSSLCYDGPSEGKFT